MERQAARPFARTRDDVDEDLNLRGTILEL